MTEAIKPPETPLEHTETLPDQIDTLLSIVPKRSWIALTTIALLLGLLAAWTFFGSIPIRLEGRGLVVSKEGLFNIQAKVKGTLSELSYKPGDFVKEGDIIAKIIDPLEQVKLEAARLKVSQLTQNLADLKIKLDKEALATKETNKKALKSKEDQATQMAINVETAATEITRKQKLKDEGLIKNQEVTDAINDAAKKKTELANLKVDISKLQAEIAKEPPSGEYENKQKELRQAIESRDILEANQANYNITSPDQGKILGIFFHKGDLIELGNVVVWLEHISSETEDQSISFEIYSFFPLEKGKKITVGEAVEVDLSMVNVQEYGSMLGKVKSVSPYAISRENLMDSIRNKELVDYLMQESTAMQQVTIVPDLDPSTPSGLRWTSGTGPDTKITTGSLATVKVTIDRLRPIYFIAPLWKLQNIGK